MFGFFRKLLLSVAIIVGLQKKDGKWLITEIDQQ